MSYEDEMRAALDTFVVEGADLVREFEAGLLALERGDTGAVDAVFRAAHTVKGSAGLFGLDRMVAFTHVVESVLDRLRTGAVAPGPALVTALLPCTDHLGELLAEVRATGTCGAGPDPVGDTLVAALRPYLDGPGPGPAAAPDAAASGAVPVAGAVPADAAVPAEAAVPADGAVRDVEVVLRFGVDCLRNGMDPVSFVRYLGTLGETRQVQVLDDRLPDLASLDPESCRLGFRVVLRTDADLVDVEDVFEFVRDDSEIVVRALTGDASGPGPVTATTGPAAPPAAGRAAGDGAGGGPGDRAADTDTDADADAADDEGSDGSDGTGGVAAPAASPGVTADAAGPATAPTPVAASGEARPGEARPGEARPGEVRPATDARGRDTSTIRIDAPRLDRLIDVVGELVIAGAGAGVRAAQTHDEALSAALGEVMRLVEEVRDSALQLRMVPIGTTFSRFQRVVRDVGADLGKDVDLVVSGGDTEVDKALVEQIGDPLLHLVRNSMDHGIEPADVRLARGKPARGTLRLNAYHDSGSIVIEVSDDGGGIDRARVLAKALERGLVDAGANLTDAEAHSLIFEPGFSTSDVVSNLSGRGVGMDVVRRNVTALRGTIDVDSEPGRGTTMRIRLPLTLAIIDGFLVGVGTATYVVPLDRVIECVELPSRADTRDCMDLRGEVLPFIRLRNLFQVPGERPRRENVVVVEYAGMKIGLVVDQLVGEFQTVIKPLGPLFAHVHGIGGSTILGNGEVALIIDVSMLVRHYGERQVPGPLAA